MAKREIKVVPVKSGFTVVLYSKSWNGKVKLKHRGFSETKEGALKIRSDIWDRGFGGHGGDYRVCGPVQLKKLIAEVKGMQDARRKKGAVKAAKTRKARGPGNFILCPSCKTKSKKLFSEFGGLQTRKCQNGHTFEYDKWIADRMWGVAIMNPGALPVVANSIYKKL
jgi:hypothetical protein